MKVSVDIISKIVRQILIVAGSIGTWIGIQFPAEAQEGIDAFIASVGPFILSVGMIWSWARDVIKWFKARND